MRHHLFIFYSCILLFFLWIPESHTRTAAAACGSRLRVSDKQPRRLENLIKLHLKNRLWHQRPAGPPQGFFTARSKFSERHLEDNKISEFRSRGRQEEPNVTVAFTSANWLILHPSVFPPPVLTRIRTAGHPASARSSNRTNAAKLSHVSKTCFHPQHCLPKNIIEHILHFKQTSDAF